MINKIIKIVILFQIILISFGTIAINSNSYKPNNVIFLNESLNKEIGSGKPPYLIGTMNKTENSIFSAIGPTGGGTTIQTNVTVTPSVTFYGMLNNKIPLFKFSNSSKYVFSMYIHPSYSSTNSPSAITPLPEGYLNQEGFKYNNGKPFSVKYIGATIILNIYAIDSSASVETIPEITIAKVRATPAPPDTAASGNAYIIIRNMTVIPSSVTCKLEKDTTQITMDSISINKFPNIGNEINGGETIINLICSKGVAKVKVGMSDITKPDNVSSKLTLSQESKAVGFAITLYHDNKIITYSPNAVSDTWELDSPSISNEKFIYKIPISAKYYRMNSVILPGSVFAKAKIIFIYE